MTNTISEACPIPHPDDRAGLDTALRWVGEFERVNGRKLRVLHIGNIANNAYNNARIQRALGIEADVLSHDYYHIMGCPEWEDAEFTGDVGDAFFPDWWATSLRGWRRPAWFASGPVEMALQNLLLRSRGPAIIEWLFRSLPEVAAWHATRKGLAAQGRSISRLPWRLAIAEKVLPRLFLRSSTEPYTYINGHPAASSARSSGPDAQKQMNVIDLIMKLSRLFYRLWFKLLNRPHPLSTLKAKSTAFMSNVLLWPLAAVRGWLVRRVLSKLSPDAVVKRDTHLAAQRERILHLNAAAPHSTLSSLDAYICAHAPRFFDAMREYDIIQGYSIDGFIPMVNGIGRYVCYEHGTLRELPFEDSLTGILCREAYLSAPWSFVTNSDVLSSVARLGLDPRRVVNLPHAFNDQKLRDFRAGYPELRPPEGPPILFSPTRQHWVDRNRSLTKGNDIMFRAAGRLACEGVNFQLVLVEWGQDVAASKALIADLGFADRVVWVPPMQKRELWTRYCTSHAVLDQFSLPALGGVGFETMALGRRLITALDRPQCDTFYGKAPPCLDAQTEEECVAKMRQIVADPHDTAGLGEAAAQWIEDYHSAQLIVARQAAVYRELMREDA